MALERGQPADALARLAELTQGGRPAYGGAAPRDARAHRGGPPRGDSAARRPARQAQGVRRRAGRAAARGRARRGARRASRTMPPGLRDYWNRLSEADRLQSAGRARGGAASFLAWAAIARPPRSSRAASSATGIRSLVVLYAECTTADATRQLETAERWLAHAQPGCDAAVRARPAVRARAAVGQGADVSRGEPRARRPLAHAPGTRRAAREARAHERGERASRCGAQAGAGGARVAIARRIPVAHAALCPCRARAGARPGARARVCRSACRRGPVRGHRRRRVLRLDQIAAQVLIDDEWHAVHQVLRRTPAQMFLDFGFADYSIPLGILAWLRGALRSAVGDADARCR